MRDHDLQKFPREWIFLYMDVPKHLVATPAANHIDNIAVYYGAEEGHETSGSEGAGRHALGFKL